MLASLFLLGWPLALGAQDAAQPDPPAPSGQTSDPQSEPPQPTVTQPPATRPPEAGAEQLPSIEVPQPVTARPAKPKQATTRQAVTSKPAFPPTPVVAVDSVISEGQGGGGDKATGNSSYLAASGHVDGYVATSSTTGTKTGAALLETPQSVSVITADQMEARAVESLTETLRYTPGVTGESFGLDLRGYGVQIRGITDASDSILYRDGLTLRGADFATFATIDPYGAERIEVLRGPASVLYGGGEPSGIINYVSKRPTYDPFREIILIGGNFDHYEGRFDLSGPISNDSKWAYRITGLGTDSSTQVDFVDYDRLFVAPALTFRPNADTSFTILTNYQKDDQGWAQQFYPAQGTVLPNPNGHIPPSRFTGEPNFDYYNNLQYSAGYLFEHRFGPTWTIRQNARYQHLENSQRGVFGLGLLPDLRSYDRYGDGGETELSSFVMDNHAEARFGTGPLSHTLLLGLDYQHHNYSDLGLEFTAPSLLLDIFDPSYGVPLSFVAPYQDTKTVQEQVGLYVQDRIKIYDKLVLQLGGRSDWVQSETQDFLAESALDINETASTGRAGLVYLFDNGLAPYASYGQSFLPVLGTDIFGDPFEPEMGEQYEVGIKYEPASFKNVLLTFAAFDLYRQNVLTNDPANLFNQIQTGEVHSRGIELEAVASLANGLNVQAAYTFLDTEFSESNDGNEGNTPYSVPDHRVSLWADYTFQYGRYEGFGFGGGVRYVSETWGDDANTFTVPDFTLADAAIHYEWGHYRLALNATNVFDTDYISACFALEFGCNYGQRRTVLGSLRYRW